MKVSSGWVVFSQESEQFQIWTGGLFVIALTSLFIVMLYIGLAINSLVQFIKKCISKGFSNFSLTILYLFWTEFLENSAHSVTVFYMDKICLLRQSKSCLLDHLWQSLLLKSCNNHQARGSCNQKQGWSVSVREASEPQVRPCILFPWLCSSFPPYPWFLLSCNLHHKPKPSLPGTWGSNRDNCLVFPQVYVY